MPSNRCVAVRRIERLNDIGSLDRSTTEHEELAVDQRPCRIVKRLRNASYSVRFARRTVDRVDVACGLIARVEPAGEVERP
jgi:hypothetical protein